MEDFVKTSDMPFAAYLMTYDYTCIACVDPEDGRGRYDFYLTHADPEIREQLFQHFNKLRDDFNSVDIRFQEYSRHMKSLKKKTFEPMRKSTYEQ